MNKIVANSLPKWAYVQPPQTTGQIKQSPEDFIVKENLGFELSGEGEFLFVLVEKKNLNTLALVDSLAKQLGLAAKNINYAGLKDKQAVTQQWLSIWSPTELDLKSIKADKFSILNISRHSKKLKRGAHQANTFEITLRNLNHSQAIEEALERVIKNGVPNYFGLQRFGNHGRNLEKAMNLFSGMKTARHERSFYLSAARSFLFNQVLSERVSQENWSTGMAGEVMMLAGSNSFFKTVELDDALNERLMSFDIHPSAPLWGKGKLVSQSALFALEQSVINQHTDLSGGLEKFGLRQQRRATRLMAQDFQYQWLGESTLKLNFMLTKGTFATTVLRELLTIEA